MNRTFFNLLLASPAVIGMSSFLGTSAAIALETSAAPEAASQGQPAVQTATTVETLALNSSEHLELNQSVAAEEKTSVSKDSTSQTVASEPSLLPETTAMAPTLAISSDKAQTDEVASTAAAIAPTNSSATSATDLLTKNLTQPSQSSPALATSGTPVAQVPANPAAPAPMTGPILPASPSAPSTSPAAAGSGMSQVTSVSQLSDVQPTDWAFQALQSLVERYGCIAGYPDGTFRGNRALTRYEFAAGLNACLDQVTRQIGAATANYITKADLAILQRLQEEFAAELAALRGRVDALEARSSFLEAHQFSTTTKLSGEAIFAVSDTFGKAVGSNRDKTSTFVSDRVRLVLNTSFTGRDLLLARLQARNTPNLNSPNFTGTNMTRLGFDGDEGNKLLLDKLFYRFPLGQSSVWLAAKGVDIDDVAAVITPFNSTGNGALSRFGQRNPAVYRSAGGGGAGAAVTFRGGSGFQATAAYISSDRDAPDPTNGRGFFRGSYTAFGQLAFALGQNVDIGLSYARKYLKTGDVDIMGGTGSTFAIRPFDQNATSSDNYAAQINFKFGNALNLGGWFGYTRAHQEAGGSKNATILNGAVNLAFPNLFGNGNLGGIIVGIPPKVTENNYRNADGSRRKDRDTSLHIEAFYRLQVNDFVSVTPGFYVITNPDHNKDNKTQWVGTLRTTFTF
ncbi:MAG: iron uptake porin [Actinomycetota bacterium]